MRKLPPPEVSPEEARDIADEVLSGRAYRDAAGPPGLRDRIFNWIADRFADAFDSLSSVGGRGPMAWIIIGAFGLLIVFLLTRLLRNLGPLPVGDADPSPTIDITETATSTEWLRRAEDAEANDDWRLGIRCRHQSLVAALASRGVLRLEQGQTAGEISAMIGAARPAAAEALTEATNLFKDTWYGWIQAAPAERDRFVELSDHVLTHAAAAGTREDAAAELSEAGSAR